MTLVYIYIYYPVPSKGLKFLLDHDCWSFGIFGVHLKDNSSRGDECARLCTIDVRSWCTTSTSSSFSSRVLSQCFFHFQYLFQILPQHFLGSTQSGAKSMGTTSPCYSASMPHKILISPAAVVLVQACSNNMSLNRFHTFKLVISTQVSTQRVDLIYPACRRFPQLQP